MRGDPIAAGDIRFFDNYKPGLRSAQYDLHIAQAIVEITGGSEEHAAPPPPIQQASADATIVVTGPRFALDPAQVQSVFPPANAIGPYTAKLPHIVLMDRSLPWERALSEATEQDSGPTIHPWLALILLAEGEIRQPDGAAADGAPDPTLTGSCTVEEFRSPTDPKIVPPLALATIPGDEPICRTVALDTATFVKVVPRREDLPYLAHVRQVDAANKATRFAATGGWYAVVIGNRFPVSGTRYIAHLVSLEGFATYLVDTPAWPSGAETVRLASLASWSFTAHDDGLDFTGLMTGVLPPDSRATPPTAPGNADRDALRLRLPPPPEQAAGSAAADAARAIALGYTACPFESRVGDATFAWLRSPLVPVPASGSPGHGGLQFASAAAATIYDADSATFDLSYATLWETGRLLALRDRAYATALQRTRRSLRSVVDLYRERSAGAADGERIADVLTPRHASRLAIARITRSAAASRSVAEPRRGLEAVLRDPATAGALAGHVATAAASSGPVADVGDWLGRLRLLEGVPFLNLVPDARMLPRESIRFFHVDPSGIDALSDGALSVGIQTGRDARQQGLVRAAFRRLAVAGAAARRAGSTGRGAADPAASGEAAAGFLLRSALVSGWPGLEVTAFADAAGTVEILPLRLDHVAPDVLIALYPEVPAIIDIAEPREALAFGVEEGFEVDLRAVCGESVGEQLAKKETLPAEMRAEGILRVAAWQQALMAADFPTAQSIWGPAAFALQMVSAPERMRFRPTGTQS